MGALLARSLVEDDATWARDVSSLILIAPVNQGSHLAKVQTVVQLSNGLKAINGKNTTKAMLNLSDGLGQAAEDMLPGSTFLKGLNRRPRRQGVPYHILAGDRGFLTREARAQIEGRIELVTRNAGIFGRVTQVATADLPDLLDELTDGTGDGCVSRGTDPARRRRRPRHDPRQSRRADPRPPALPRPGPGRLHAGRPALAQGRSGAEGRWPGAVEHGTSMRSTGTSPAQRTAGSWDSAPLPLICSTPGTVLRRKRHRGSTPCRRPSRPSRTTRPP